MYCDNIYCFKKNCCDNSYHNLNLSNCYFCKKQIRIVDEYSKNLKLYKKYMEILEDEYEEEEEDKSVEFLNLCSKCLKIYI